MFPPTSFSYRAAELGAAYEATLPAADRKRLGVWYTPPDLAHAISARALASLGFKRPVTVLDPACGAGVFLAAVRELVSEVRLHGVDVDPGAVALAREAVPEGEFRAGEALLGVDFAAVFPEVMAQGGFDLVITNPPYVRADVSALRARVVSSGQVGPVLGIRRARAATAAARRTGGISAVGFLRASSLCKVPARMARGAPEAHGDGRRSPIRGRSGQPGARGIGIGIGDCTLADVCFISYGLRANSDERRWPGEFVTADLLADSPDDRHSRPYVEGKDLGGLRVLRTRHLEWGTDRAPARFARRSFDEFLSASPKILALCISGDRVVCALDAQSHAFNHTIVGIVPWHLLADCSAIQVRRAAQGRNLRQAPDFDVRYLLAILQSWQTRAFLASIRRSRKHIYPDDWRAVPIPAAPPETGQPSRKPSTRP